MNPDVTNGTEVRTSTIPRDAAVAAGRAAGLVPNRLALLKLPDGGSFQGAVPPDWAPLLPLLLRPVATGDITVVGEGGRLAQSNWMMNADGGLVYGVREGQLTLRATSAEALADELLDFLEPYETRERIPAKLSLGPAAMLVLAAMADCRRRLEMELLLVHGMASLPLTVEGVARQLDEARQEMDIRWLAPFLLELYGGEAPAIDITAALAQLAALELVLPAADGTIPLTEGGEVLMRLLARCRVMAGVRCMFYYEGVTSLANLALLRTPEHLWYVDMSKEGMLCGISPELAALAVEELLCLGEAPPEASVPVQSVPHPTTGSTAQQWPQAAPIPDGTPASIGWSCACGRTNTEAFCPSCGRQAGPAMAPPVVPPTPTPRCRQCGAVLSQKAVFCNHCGTPVA